MDSDKLERVISALDCPVCLCMYCEPISLGCGHTFCRVCLVSSLRQVKKKCPACRAVCNLAPEKAAENNTIREICITLDPVMYAERAAEAEKIKEGWSELLPIFFYNEALFPGAKLNLHLFEPRYRLLAQRAVETTRMFAYCANFTNYSANVGDVIIVAKLEDVEFMPDGRCMIEAKLTSRQIVVEHFGALQILCLARPLFSSIFVSHSIINYPITHFP